MPSDEPAKSRRSDPALDFIDNALHDSAVVLDAYARFATTVIGTLLFPYAATRPVTSAPKQSDPELPPKLRYHGIVNVVIALIIGAFLGRRLFARRRALADVQRS